MEYSVYDTVKKKIGITQKVNFHEQYQEQLDCLDQRWYDFLLEIDLIPIPLPNIPKKSARELFENLEIDGLILSGGNSVSINGSKPQGYNLRRDSFESYFLEQCIASDIPVIGVCRGMQFINVFFGGDLVKIDGHAGSHKHPILQTSTGSPYHFPKDVNTYHNFGISQSILAANFEILATDAQGNIEAFKHKLHNITAIMWHPERSIPFLEQDKTLFTSIFHD